MSRENRTNDYIGVIWVYLIFQFNIKVLTIFILDTICLSILKLNGNNAIF